MIEQRITQFSQLVDAARSAVERFGRRVVWFRGQASSREDWTLVAPIHRNFTDHDETDMVQKFRLEAVSRHEKSPDRDDIAGWLCLMRHYGLPTRLLDWTKSILVAAFFAVGYKPEQGSATIWAVSPGKLNGVCRKDDRIYLLGQQEVLPVLLPAFRSGQPVRQEALGVLATEIDLRMMLQQSCFTIHGSPTALEEMKGSESFLIKFIIPETAKPTIAEDLRLLGIRTSTIFPDLGHLAMEITETQRRITASEQHRPKNQ